MRSVFSAVFAIFAFFGVVAAAQSPAITIRAASAFDGKGRSISNPVVTVRDGKIVSVASGAAGAATYDLRGLTLLPGLIDTHVHLDTHFNADGKPTSRGESPVQSILYEAENAYIVLAAGFTTVQSIGSPLDVPVRAAIARGVMPGPRLLTSIDPINENTGTPDQIRAFVRKLKADGADLVKLFASKSSREGGTQTMPTGRFRRPAARQRRWDCARGSTRTVLRPSVRQRLPAAPRSRTAARSPTRS